VEQAQSEAPPLSSLLKIQRNYARVIILTGLLLVILPPFLWNWDWETTIYRALIFLVVASPCALMAAIMPRYCPGLPMERGRAFCLRVELIWKQLVELGAIALDKTGTPDHRPTASC